MHELDKTGLEAARAPERLWLSASDYDNEHNVWFDPDEGGTEYVRADLASSASPGVTEEQTPRVTDAMVARATTSLFNCVGDPLAKRNVRAALEASRSPVSQKEAEPVAAKYPLATFGDPDVLPLGLFRIHWASGGSSLAAVGMMENGDRWIAPTNWISPCLDPTNEFAWGGIERVELIPVPAPAGEPATAADKIIGEIEQRFPNWRGYRDLIDCIDCTLHDLRSPAVGEVSPNA